MNEFDRRTGLLFQEKQYTINVQDCVFEDSIYIKETTGENI